MSQHSKFSGSSQSAYGRSLQRSVDQQDRPRPHIPSHLQSHRRSYPSRSFLGHDTWQQQQQHQYRVWSTSGDSNYEAILQADAASSSRPSRHSISNRRGDRVARSKGIKGKDFGYAFIGKEAEEYAQNELRDQLQSAVGMFVPGEAVAPSPLNPTNLTPQDAVQEFKRAGHFDAVRKQLTTFFQASVQKTKLLDSLEAYLLKRIADMTPEARQRLAAKDPRLQLSDLTSFVEESTEAADYFDELFKDIRSDPDSEKSILGTQGSVGKDLVCRLADILHAEKQRREQRKSDSSDDEGGSTPLDRGNVTPAQDVSSSRGSETPLTIVTEAT